jgi:SAM-dependent methyltransferase
MTQDRDPEAVTREWFRDWFGEDYLALYPHRDAREAAAAVELFLATVPPEPEARVIDLACGAGRHLRALTRASLQAFGLDLSLVLLLRAREKGSVPLVCGDMRALPLASGSFGGLTSFFTSFGYFDTRQEDRAVLGEMRRVLSPNGSFVLDFLNAGHVRRNLVREDERTICGKRITQRRSIEGGAVVKRILIEPGGRGPTRQFIERVRLYEGGELEVLLNSSGLHVTHRFGDYNGGRLEEQSPRLILAGRAV